MDLAQYPTDSTAMLINESAAKAMGFADPIGQIVKDDDYRISGCRGYKRFYYWILPYDHTRPMVIEGAKENWFNVINIRLSDEGSIETASDIDRKLYEKYNPAYPFEYHFVDEDYARKFDDTQRIATITRLVYRTYHFYFLPGLVRIGCYMAEIRIKEIGIRKVLGASVLKITALLSKDFLILVIISIIIAITYSLVCHAYMAPRIFIPVEIEWWVFVMSGLLCIVISLLTISFQAIKAALANPVKSLRTE